MAGEIRAMLEGLDAGPGSRLGDVYVPMSSEAAPNPDAAARPFVGEPLPFPPGWDDGWQTALLDWMAVENLEERAAAPGRIDPRVLDVLQRRAAAR
jgi:hypothetical protein